MIGEGGDRKNMDRAGEVGVRAVDFSLPAAAHEDAFRSTLARDGYGSADNGEDSVRRMLYSSKSQAPVLIAVCAVSHYALSLFPGKAISNHIRSEFTQQNTPQMDFNLLVSPRHRITLYPYHRPHPSNPPSHGLSNWSPSNVPHPSPLIRPSKSRIE